MSAAEKATNRILDDLRRVVDDAEGLMRETAGVAGERAEAARARAAESVREARARLETMEAELLSRARDAAQTTDRYVRQNPWQSIGVAAGAGLLLGLLIGRR